MAEPPRAPSLSDIVMPHKPVYLRKLDRKADWGNDELPPAQRIEDAVRLVFHRDTHPYSVYLVRTDEDLRRVIIGMNGGRQSLSSESYFIALHAEDLQAVGLHASHTPGEGITACGFANSLHHDIVADEVKIAALCAHLFRRACTVHYFSKGRTRLLIPEAEAIGCLAATKETSGCKFEACA